MEQNHDRTLAEQLTHKTEVLVETIETLINDYEDETGISVARIAVRFDESECAKKVSIRCNYYNFEQALVGESKD